MAVWVVNGIINSSMLYDVDDNVLQLFSEISTDIVKRDINTFIRNNIESGNERDRVLAERLKNAFANINAVDAYLSSDEAKNLVDTLVSLDYRDITCSTELSTLRMWRDMILDLLSEDKDFIESYQGETSGLTSTGPKPAYTKKYDKDNLEGILAEMNDICFTYPVGSPQRISTSNLISVIGKFKKLFKNGNYKLSKPTVMRAATFKKDKLKNILRGLDYLIPKVQEGKSAYGWRIL